MALMQTTPGGTPAHPAGPEPAVEVHGRVMTTNQQAAACYREAQRAAEWGNAVVALRLAVAADAAFGVAVAESRRRDPGAERPSRKPADELGTPPRRSGWYRVDRRCRPGLRPPPRTHRERGL